MDRPTTTPSHYDTLGVARGAPPEVVRAAFLALAKIYHPDGASPDEERMKRINLAWETLRLPAGRASYDAELARRNGRSADPAPAPTSPTATSTSWGDDGPGYGRRGWGDEEDGPHAATVVDHDDDLDDDDDDDRPGYGRDGWGEEVDDGPPGHGPAGFDWGSWGQVADPAPPPTGPLEVRRGLFGRYADRRDRVRSDPTAVMGRRGAAMLVDAFLLVVLSLQALQLAVPAAFERATPPEGGSVADVCAVSPGVMCVTQGDRAYVAEDNGDVALAALGAAAPFLLIFVVVQGRTGATPGKGLVGIRTVTGEGRRPGMVRALVRTMAWAVDGLPYVVPLVALSRASTSAGHRRIGDVAAGTFVVRARDVGCRIIVPDP
ncbi:MAG TPA: RDD family protein [Acidimicrobiales bacterium]